MGVNGKLAAATKARKSSTSVKKEEIVPYQHEGDDETMSWAAKRREEKAEKRAEAAAMKAEKRADAAARKAETRLLAKQEAKQLERSKIKVTEAELERSREMNYLELKQRSHEDEMKQRRMVDENDYLKIVTMANTNRDDSVIEGRTVEEAIEQMMVVDKLHQRQNRLFKVFEDAELERLKEEKPGLTFGQYKDLISESWKKINVKKVVPLIG
ncbi:hypothetical protein MIMGU_mgv1a018284mg [Erythranthe guttata]|uniref:Coiled-coil domain-containing protein n=1 Tax=Erythranthe guttata TaxID=4155 RepID=A0A022QFY4_ERYGU|nr:PREDICTED: coiled-coil domain-containing protein 124-like [Erythranthe guttata]EYU26158.1 hypothetical protein MIMGU_mgv1a018284mg [Erythranthe guttata]|eukprot:XP_012850840.1 PREDICTED: coiled-coil domain-containing protein 124-like [Erythranthe guttata]